MSAHAAKLPLTQPPTAPNPAHLDGVEDGGGPEADGPNQANDVAEEGQTDGDEGDKGDVGRPEHDPERHGGHPGREGLHARHLALQELKQGLGEDLVGRQHVDEDEDVGGADEPDRGGEAGDDVAADLVAKGDVAGHRDRDVEAGDDDHRHVDRALDVENGTPARRAHGVGDLHQDEGEGVGEDDCAHGVEHAPHLAGGGVGHAVDTGLPGAALVDGQGQRDDGVGKGGEHADGRHHPQRVHVGQLGQDQLGAAKDDAEHPVLVEAALALGVAVGLRHVGHGGGAGDVVCSDVSLK